MIPLSVLLCALLNNTPMTSAISSASPASTIAVTAPASAKRYPVAEGSFIQEYLARDWTDAQWQEEFRHLREVGMTYLVFGSTANSKDRVTFYPTRVPGYQLAPGYSDTIDACLRNAEKAGFKVFLGLNFHPDWWKKAANDREWLLAQMRDGNAIADELWERYGKRYPNAFHGWYWVWEVDNLNYRTPEQIDTLTAALDTNVRHLKSLTPGKPIMLCPFMNYRLGKPDEYCKLWETVFARCALGPGDIFCPQDCVGAGGLTMDNYVEWFAALSKVVAKKPGLRFWSDAETFIQEDWTSAPLQRFVTQLHGVQPYVEKSITFAYSHYYSPSTVQPGFQTTYREYVRTGRLETVPPTAPTEFQGTRLPNGGVRLSWRVATDNIGVCGYYIFRDGKQISRMQSGKDKDALVRERLEWTDTQAPPGVTATYTIQAYDYAGNTSPTAGPLAIQNSAP